MVLYTVGGKKWELDEDLVVPPEMNGDLEVLLYGLLSQSPPVCCV